MTRHPHAHVCLCKCHFLVYAPQNRDCVNLAVSTDTFLGLPGSSIEFGSKILLTHLQLNSCQVWSTLDSSIGSNILSSFFNSSLAHSTPLLWYWPCLLLGRTPSFLIRSVRHCLTVLSDFFFIISATYSAALVSVNAKRVTSWLHKNIARDFLPSWSNVSTQPSANS